MQLFAYKHSFLYQVFYKFKYVELLFIDGMTWNLLQQQVQTFINISDSFERRIHFMLLLLSINIENVKISVQTK